MEGGVLDSIIGVLRRVSRFGSWVGGVLLFIMATYICVDVLLRKFFSVSIGGTEEFSGYTWAVISGWAFAYALFEKAHVRIDIFYLKLPIKWRCILDLLSLIVLLVFMVPMVYYAFGVFSRSVSLHSVSNTPTQTPLWIPQSLWFIGLAFFLLVIFIVFVITFFYVVRGDFTSAYRISGSTSVEEEIEMEIEPELLSGEER